MSANTNNAIALPIDAMALRSKPTARTIAIAAVRSSPAGARPPYRRPSRRWELAGGRHLLAQAGGRVQPGVGGARGCEQGGDAHQPVAGTAEDRFGSDRDGGPARGDDLFDGEGAEDTEHDRDVDDSRDAQRVVQGPRAWRLGLGQVLGGEGDDTEAQEGEEREARRCPRCPSRAGSRRRRATRVDVRQGHDREDGEDADHDDHDEGLDVGDGAAADDVEEGHGEDDHDREELRPLVELSVRAPLA